MGGGASGVLLAAHLLGSSRSNQLVTIVEKREQLGAGIAYATTDPEHLLNVRAANMSAFPDDPMHFLRWLRAGDALHEISDAVAASSFAPRALYRRYLSSLLEPHFLEGRLRVVRGEAVSVRESDGEVAIEFHDGSIRFGDNAVLATGNEGPSLPQKPWRLEGWDTASADRIERDTDVVIVGSGLTMVDWVLTLLHRGHRGRISAISRQGLTPHAHQFVTPSHVDADAVPFGASIADLTRWLRAQVRKAEAESLDWRSVVDALRPHTQRLWQELAGEERVRFLRHVRPWWDQHRHRVAPETGRQLAAAVGRGQVRVVAARVLEFADRDTGVDVLIRRRRHLDQEIVHADAVIECRGRAKDITATENPVLRSLLASGAARPDPLGLGLDIAPDCALVGETGHPCGRLSAVGPLTSGAFWEIVAIPDIRLQVAGLARRLLAEGEEAQTDAAIANPARASRRA